MALSEGFCLENSSSSTTKNNNVVESKFYKIILSQDECIRLRIPKDFVKRCCNNILNPVYLEVPSGQVWEVEVKHSQGQIWLTKGWQDFCDYYSISFGHFLMFGYNARSHFNVTIFDLSAAEIEYPYSLRTFHCHETHLALETDLSESDYSVDILEDIPRSLKLKEKVPDMVDHSVENLGDGQFSKRKRHEDDVASPSFTREGQTSKFARKYFLENDGNLVLRVPGSGSWSVKCTIGTANAKVGSGWKAFVLENKLKVGDVCVFEVLKGQLFVDVIIFRAVGSTLVEYC
ncbi:hypothetical protein R3W88_004340 [Solanum pinnatisectum]|uniref:TF-B3 domain-containing protein n=1 Tax=Solanum pinnatisectum TaxID=50273 RepID=A0AAV9KCM8_9SOLN|nr:hypothetical protein R3W88_004340 [Solanum pinnatisectum]